MTQRTILYVASEEPRMLRRIRFVAPTALSRSKENYYVIQVGVAFGDRTDYFGTFDGSKDLVEANTPFDLTGDADVDFALEPDSLVVADVTTRGSPLSVLGAGFSVHVPHAIDEPTRRDEGRSDRDGLTALLEFIRSSGAGDDRLFVPMAIASEDAS